MKVAVLADVHANLPALVAVLEDLPNVDCIACLGDVVGYYADPNEVCALMRQHKIITIRGNHDAYVLGERLPHSDRVEAYRTAWTREVLEPRNFGWLRSLPTSMECRWGKIVAHLHHATPWNEEAYLYPDSDQLNEIKLGPNEFLALGHTHRPMLRQCGEGFVLNPGSVGQPRDCNPLASYAILDCDTANVDFRRARYDVTSLQRRLRELGWEPSTIAILSRTERQGETSNPARSGDRKQHHK
jgi:putative phosphoesterase